MYIYTRAYFMFYYAITNLWINVHSYKYICKPMSSGPEQHCSRIFIYLHLDGQRDPGTKKSTIFDFFSSSILRYYYYLFWLPQIEKKMPMVQLSNSRISFFQKVFSLKTTWSVALLINGPPIFPAHPIPFICAIHCIICIVFVGNGLKLEKKSDLNTYQKKFVLLVFISKHFLNCTLIYNLASAFSPLRPFESFNTHYLF